MTEPRTGVTPPAASRYPRTSRYHETPARSRRTRDGREIPYLRRRVVPHPESLGDLTPHTVSEGERPDLLGERYFGVADAWWRVADANPVLDPRELTATPGRRIAIPDPGADHG